MARKQSCTEERFLKDAAAHQMEVLRDDGVNRHLRFKNPESSAYWFEIITWPGTLCIDGDMGTFVFRRLQRRSVWPQTWTTCSTAKVAAPIAHCKIRCSTCRARGCCDG